jgi:multidrug efflux system membrane fusion protein
VAVATAETRDVPVFVRGIGTVQAYNTVHVKSRIDGQIVKVHFREGQDVKTGDVLFTLDSRAAEAQLRQAEAQLTRDRAQLVNAKREVERQAELIQKNFTSGQKYDEMRPNAAALEATLAEAGARDGWQARVDRLLDDMSWEQTWAQMRDLMR